MLDNNLNLKGDSGSNRVSLLLTPEQNLTAQVESGRLDVANDPREFGRQSGVCLSVYPDRNGAIRSI
jgi:hypothetical protein